MCPVKRQDYAREKPPCGGSSYSLILLPSIHAIIFDRLFGDCPGDVEAERPDPGGCVDRDALVEEVGSGVVGVGDFYHAFSARLDWFLRPFHAGAFATRLNIVDQYGCVCLVLVGERAVLRSVRARKGSEVVNRCLE